MVQVERQRSLNLFPQSYLSQGMHTFILKGKKYLYR